MWRACNPLADFAAIRGLQPTDPPDEVSARLASETRDLMLVGHMPSLPRLLQALTQDNNAAVPPHGLVALEWDGVRWRENWRME